MVPDLGKIVFYKLADEDVREIVERRGSVRDFVGEPVATGDVYPMIITEYGRRQPNSPVSGQVFLTGSDVHYVSGAVPGTIPGTFDWLSP